VNTIIKKISKIISWAVDSAGFVAGMMIVLGMILIVIEILLRKLFNSTLYISDEYSAYLNVAIAFMSFSYALKEDAHVRVKIIDPLLKSDNSKYLLETICYIVAFIFSICMFYFCSKLFWDSLISHNRSMQVSRTYLAIPQFFMLMGTLLLSLSGVNGIIKNYSMYRKSKLNEKH